ncbi:hypothetical protein JHS3_22070 [Jeongeupia sp. HS-3]|uniref:hypothetical protein n=1 Tax=Jeongeupia sp. HS-3 TaxID=1009682 RepID=UPI0018A3AE90|nr:hypothetical protein [Jeongeupia sp. HS-3]BCL76471.1 hypothetical protein JHS3_22070 [Jeongeupia sp. HS-3]
MGERVTLADQVWLGKFFWLRQLCFASICRLFQAGNIACYLASQAELTAFQAEVAKCASELAIVAIQNADVALHPVQKSWLRCARQPLAELAFLIPGHLVKRDPRSIPARIIRNGWSVL